MAQDATLESQRNQPTYLECCAQSTTKQASEPVEVSDWPRPSILSRNQSGSCGSFRSQLLHMASMYERLEAENHELRTQFRAAAARPPSSSCACGIGSQPFSPRRNVGISSQTRQFGSHTDMSHTRTRVSVNSNHSADTLPRVSDNSNHSAASEVGVDIIVEGTGIDVVASDPFLVQTFSRQRSYCRNQRFWFKQREWSGSDIHLAALEAEGERAIARLVELRADAEEKCASMGDTAAPIHLAAGMGYEDNVRCLVALRADVGALTTATAGFRVVTHYTPLHEAAYAGKVSTVQCLIELRADPLARNMFGQSPLHAVARGAPHAYEVAQALREAKADASMRDNYKMTALQIALKSGCFESEMLSALLMDHSINELLDAAEQDPKGTVCMLRSGGGDEWTQCLLAAQNRQPNVLDICDILVASPLVCAELIDMLTEEPTVKNPFQHPLPRNVLREAIGKGRIVYVPDTVWEFDWRGDIKPYPDWHDVLEAKLQEGRRKRRYAFFRQVRARVLDQPRGRQGVEVRLFQVQNVVRSTFLFCISELSGCERTLILTKPAIQAAIDYTWVNVVSEAYNMHLMNSVLKLVVLIWVVYFPSQYTLARRCCWSLFTTTCMRDAVRELSQMRGYKVAIQQPMAYLNPWNGLDMTALGLGLYVAWQSSHSMIFDIVRPLSALSFARWMEVMFMLRAYAFMSVGIKVLSIFISFFQITGIGLICIFTLFAFVHCYSALDNQHSLDMVIEYTFRFLFLGDGDGLNFVLGLGKIIDSDSTDDNLFNQCLMYFSTIVVFICILNLFIAVHGSAYEAVRAQKTEIFYAERASICLKIMLEPRWVWNLPFATRSYNYFLVMVPAVGVWFGLLFVAESHAFFPSIFLLIVMLFADSFLRKLPWEESTNFVQVKTQTAAQRLRHPSRRFLTSAQALKTRMGWPISQRSSDPRKPLYLWWCKPVEQAEED